MLLYVMDFDERRRLLAKEMRNSLDLLRFCTRCS
jgi:hypothetical protein